MDLNNLLDLDELSKEVWDHYKDFNPHLQGCVALMALSLREEGEDLNMNNHDLEIHCLREVLRDDLFLYNSGGISRSVVLYRSSLYNDHLNEIYKPISKLTINSLYKSWVSVFSNKVLEKPLEKRLQFFLKDKNEHS